ncbi:DnaJ family domain-containing protein [Microbacterium sp. 2FI]|uniref:DnaJ family domain-containing protein n=1 Tax=Microbacterium sp. 2FI TaxID=2502193 RepID=UPI0010F7CD3D|nr:DnaJ family domain-containing protein [Microbacterium sp. 2FI]
MSDAMSNAARYAAQRAAGEDTSTGSDEGRPTMSLNAENKSAFIETAIQQAIRRGEFDDLPGSGKPLEGLGTHHDPDWWIRRKIETENLTGLGPPALTLRSENLELDAQLDREPTEARVREILDDFNRRVVDARRQLQGGPPVVTPTRDVEAEVHAWRERRAATRAAAQQADAAAEIPARRRRRWFRR